MPSPVGPTPKAKCRAFSKMTVFESRVRARTPISSWRARWLTSMHLTNWQAANIITNGWRDKDHDLQGCGFTGRWYRARSNGRRNPGPEAGGKAFRIFRRAGGRDRWRCIHRCAWKTADRFGTQSGQTKRRSFARGHGRSKVGWARLLDST